MVDIVPILQYPCISIDSLWSGVDAAAWPKMDVGCRNCICGWCGRGRGIVCLLITLGKRVAACASSV